MEAYRKTIEQLTKEFADKLGERVDAIILYGSAARGQYKPFESDIDILVVGEAGDVGLKSDVSQIIGDIDLQNSTATSLVYLSKSDFEQYLDWGSPFLESVLKEGVILYDRGILKQIHRSIDRKGR